MKREEFIRSIPKVNTFTSRLGSASGSNNFTNHPNTDRQSSVLKKSSSLAHTSKVVGYETTGLIYVKRAEEESNKLVMVYLTQESLKKQIKEVEIEIERRRQEIANQKRKNTKVRPMRKGSKDENPYPQLNLDPDDPQIVKYLRYRKTFDLTRPNEMKKELTLVEETMANLKKGFNSWKGESRGYKSEIDSFRREVLMYQRLQAMLMAQLEKRDGQFQQIFSQTQAANQNFALTYQELVRRKITKAHEQTNIIKQYDEVLKKLQKDMELDRLKQLAGEKPNFYMTEVNMSESKSPGRRYTPSSPARRRRMANKPLAELLQQLRNYDELFQKIKAESGTDSIEQISKQYRQNYQENYRLYRYINNMNDELGRLTEQHNELLRRLEQARTETRVNYSRIKQDQIRETRQQLNTVTLKKHQHEKEISEYNKIVKDIKLSIPTILQRLAIGEEDLKERGLRAQDVDVSNLIDFMEVIEKKKKQLKQQQHDLALSLSTQRQAPQLNSSQVEEQIEAAKKEFALYSKGETERKLKQAEQKHMKFNDREEFIKGLEDPSHKFKKLKLKKT